VTAWVEAVAVLLGLAYLLLAVREQRLCWLAGGLSSLLFAWLFQRAALPAQALLQAYYVAVAVHGWWHWGRDSGATTALSVRRWRPGIHLLVLGAVGVATLCTLAALGDYGMRALLDTALAWGSVVATWMVARKILENWLYWIVIDSIACLLYLDSSLPATAGLYALYALIAVFGWRRWRAHFRQESGA
jgi:nicotinamide mononucleotide transporter